MAPGRPHRVRLAFAVLALGWFAGVAIWYVTQSQYYDPSEPPIAAIAWLFDLGKPMYHDPASAERYAHVYGPWAFIFPGWMLRLAGPGIAASKAAGAVAAIAAMALMFRTLRRVRDAES